METSMESIVGSFHGVASDKRPYRVCGYPQRVMRLVSVDIAFCLEYRDGLYSHKLVHRHIYICLTPCKGTLQSLVPPKARKNNKSQDYCLRNFRRSNENRESRKRRGTLGLLIMHFWRTLLSLRQNNFGRTSFTTVGKYPGGGDSNGFYSILRERLRMQNMTRRVYTESTGEWYANREQSPWHIDSLSGMHGVLRWMLSVYREKFDVFH